MAAGRQTDATARSALCGGGGGWNVGRKEEVSAGKGKGRTPAAVSKAQMRCNVPLLKMFNLYQSLFKQEFFNWDAMPSI